MTKAVYEHRWAYCLDIFSNIKYKWELCLQTVLTKLGCHVSTQGLGRVGGWELSRIREEGWLANKFELDIIRVDGPPFLAVADPVPGSDPGSDGSGLDNQKNVKIPVGANGSCHGKEPVTAPEEGKSSCPDWR